MSAAGGPAAFVTAHDGWKAEYARLFDAMGPRRYLLTFHGTRYIDHEGALRYDLRFLHDPSKVTHPPVCPVRSTLLFISYEILSYRILSTPPRAQGIIVSLSCQSETNKKDLARQPRFSLGCDEDAQLRRSGNYSFADAASTVFGLVPAGRQPATYRLAELLLGGSIPILYLADKSYRLPYSLSIGTCAQPAIISGRLADPSNLSPISLLLLLLLLCRLERLRTGGEYPV